MIHLLVTSMIWAFSFPLIGHQLRGVDPFFVGAARLLVAMLVFWPLRGSTRNLPPGLALRLMLLGTIQYGFMYVFYLQAFSHLASHEVALFTIFTPLHATLLHDVLSFRFHRLFFLTSCLAVIGAAWVKYTEWGRMGFGTGFLLVQASNLCFAFGQIYYRHVMKKHAALRDTEVFWLLYAGAALVPLGWLAARGLPPAVITTLSPVQWGVLLYLGAIASGVCFFLWNAGARRVNAGALAIFNNLKIPLAMLVAMLFFGERTHAGYLLAGGAVITLSLVLNERCRARS